MPFRLAVVLNAGIVYDHRYNRARLSWPEVKQLYHSGWDILNHGYHHMSKYGTLLIKKYWKHKTVNEKLGFMMTQFVVPGGDHDPGHEHDYEKDALLQDRSPLLLMLVPGPQSMWASV